MTFNFTNVFLITFVTVVILLSSIGIVIAIRFQNRKKQKYDELKRIINENKDATLQMKDGLTKEEINNIDNEINVDLLMNDLYNTYLTLENKIKNYDTNLDDIVIGFLKEFNINKIENFREKGFSDVTDSIDLINYSIVEFTKNRLKFRLTINCFVYKTANGVIVSGSNVEKIQRILLLTYEKVNDKWLISNYDKIFEKKLSD